MNNIFLQLRFSEDPELKTDMEGNDYVRFVGAVRRNSQKTDFFNFIAFNDRARFIYEHFSKGARIDVRGELWNDADYDGNKDVICIREVDFADNRCDEREHDVADGENSYGVYAPPAAAKKDMPEPPVSDYDTQARYYDPRMDGYGTGTYGGSAGYMQPRSFQEMFDQGMLPDGVTYSGR